MIKLALLVGVIVAASLVTVGFASITIPSNFMEIFSGGTDITSPISAADIAFHQNTITVDPDGTPNNGDEYFQTIVDACKFHSAQTLPTGSTIICNLSNAKSNIVAAGSLTLTQPYSPPNILLVPMQTFVGPSLTTTDVQNIQDVKLIALGPKVATVFPSTTVGANVNFQTSIIKVDADGNPTTTNDDYLLTVITACLFNLNINLAPGTILLCQLTDANSNVVAQGSTTFPTGYTAGTQISIAITDLAFPNSNDIQIIQDVHIKIFGPKPTRTPGFWGVHVIASKHVLGVTSTADCGSGGGAINTANCAIPPMAGGIPIKIGGTTHGKFIDDLPTYFASLQCPGSTSPAPPCTDIAKNSDGTSRTSLNQAREQLTFQLVAAIMNCKIGSSPGSDTDPYMGNPNPGATGLPFLDSSCNAPTGTAAGNALNGNNRGEIIRVASLLNGFNNSGDTTALPSPLPGTGVACPTTGACGSADPNTAASVANAIFNDAGTTPAGETCIASLLASCPTANGLSGVKGYDDLYWSDQKPLDIRFNQPFDI